MTIALQHRIPFFPDDALMVSKHLAVSRKDGRVTFFDPSGPIFTYDEHDESSLRFAAAMLSDPVLGLATPGQIAKGVGRHRSRVHDFRKRYHENGAEALEVKRRGPQGASKLKGIVLARAQKFLNEGRTNRKVAKLVGVSEGTIRKGLQEGRLSRPTRVADASEKDSEQAPSTPRKRSDEDASCAGGVATKREEERALAPTGLLVEAAPKFEAAESVAKAGVLVALPALLGQGLVDVGQQVYGRLKNGYYGLTSMLLTFGLMALIRIKSTEGLTGHAPGEFGLVLGLDRAPEMKTARRKLAELASHGNALSFCRAFTERWANETPDALGYLYIDGHVRPYHGRKHKIPKTHVQRRRLCMPATTDYWVNDANAEPLMFVTAPANEGLLAMMDQEVLPQIRRLVGDERRVTLIFDREGWSPKRFQKWSKSGFDVLTYRKGKYRDWQRRCFSEVTVEVCGRQVKYLLGERMVRMAKGFRMREVRRLCDDGHQTSVMTTRRDLSLQTVALRMFCRWQQENFFRYMRHEFALDHLPTTAVEPADPERSVPNPKVKDKKRELGKVKAKLTKAEQAYGQKVHDNQEQKRRTVRGFKISHAELGRKIKKLRAARERLEAELKALPARVPVREVMDGEPVVQLERERKTITDTLKMVAYRAETQLANLVGPLLPYRNDEARKFIRQVFGLPADLLPDYERGKLVVRLHSMTTPRDNRALAALCDVLNDLKVCYPDTKLRLVFEAQQAALQSR
ncbi:MAG: putative transposase [Anaerolineae bacterium]